MISQVSPNAKPSMTGQAQLLNYPPFLLIVGGGLIGLNFPLSKLAASVGIFSLSWIALIALGASLAMMPMIFKQKRKTLISGKALRYCLIAGPITFIGPHLLVFWVVPEVGAGFTGLMFSLSPVFTLLFARIAGLKTTSKLGSLGIILGLSGAILISVTRSSIGGSERYWFVIAISIPVLLALGNIYRTLDWPEEESPSYLAFWSNLFAFLLVTLVLIFFYTDKSVLNLFNLPLLVVSQLVISGVTAPVVFRLQRKGGPVLLSQMGYVAAAVSLILSSLILNETYRFYTWVGAAMILVGIILTVIANRAPD